MQEIRDNVYGELEELDTEKMADEIMKAKEKLQDLEYEIVPPEDFQKAKDRVGKRYKIKDLKKAPRRKKFKVKTRRRK